MDLEYWTKVGAAVGVLLRLGIYGIRFFAEVRAKRKFEVSGALDAQGTIEVQIQNKSEDPIKVGSIELVEDDGTWREIWRKVTGLECVTRFRILGLDPRFNSVENVPGNDSVKLQEVLDSSVEEVAKLRRRMISRPMARVQVQGRQTLTVLDFVDGLLKRPGDKFAASANEGAVP